MERIFALSIHADYRCKHSGVCCTSDWDVPVELPIYRNLDAAMKEERLRAAGVPRDLGESSLPYTCRDFPRLAVRDERGTFISLTHYCPTAAASLFRDDVPLEIVADPQAFPPAEYEGLAI